MGLYPKHFIILFSIAVFCTSCFIEGSNTYLSSGLYQDQLCGFQVNQNNGTRFNWPKKKLPINFYIHESVPTEAHLNFISSTQQWNEIWYDYLDKTGIPSNERIQLFKVSNPRNQFEGKQKIDRVNMLFFIHDDFSHYSDRTGQAITINSALSGAGIEDTDIVVNNKDFKFYYDERYNEAILASRTKAEERRGLASSMDVSFWSTIRYRLGIVFQKAWNMLKTEVPSRDLNSRKSSIPSNKVDFPSLMIHELGHSIGLIHPQQSKDLNRYGYQSVSTNNTVQGSLKKLDTVMFSKLATGSERRKIGNYDLSNLYCGYYESE